MLDVMDLMLVHQLHWFDTVGNLKQTAETDFLSGSLPHKLNQIENSRCPKKGLWVTREHKRSVCVPLKHIIFNCKWMCVFICFNNFGKLKCDLTNGRRRSVDAQTRLCVAMVMARSKIFHRGEHFRPFHLWASAMQTSHCFIFLIWLTSQKKDSYFNF